MTDEPKRNIEYFCLAEIQQVDGTIYHRPWYQYANSPEEAAELAIGHLMLVGAQHGETVREIKVTVYSDVVRFEPNGPRPWRVRERTEGHGRRRSTSF